MCIPCDLREFVKLPSSWPWRVGRGPPTSGSWLHFRGFPGRSGDFRGLRRMSSKSRILYVFYRSTRAVPHSGAKPAPRGKLVPFWTPPREGLFVNYRKIAPPRKASQKLLKKWLLKALLFGVLSGTPAHARKYSKIGSGLSQKGVPCTLELLGGSGLKIPIFKRESIKGAMKTAAIIHSLPETESKRPVLFSFEPRPST